MRPRYHAKKMKAKNITFKTWKYGGVLHELELSDDYKYVTKYKVNNIYIIHNRRNDNEVN
jgi:pimeloyl-CoA synthetase